MLPKQTASSLHNMMYQRESSVCCNRLHNTKTRQNTFNIILWRLLSKKASKFRSRISNLVPFLDDHMQTEHSTLLHWTNLVFGSPLYCYLKSLRKNDYFGSRFTWAVRGLFEAELLLSIRVGSRVTNTQMPRNKKNKFFLS